MLNSTQTSFELARSLLQENVSSRDILFSLAVIQASLGYICYARYWPRKKTHPTSIEHTSVQNDHLANCNYANIKVSKLLIHPIKSCRGTSVQEARYTEEGLEHDRRLAIIDATTHKVITAREQPRMVLIYPQLCINEDGGHVRISFPEDSGCETFTIPLNPSSETLAIWQRLGDVVLWESNDIDSYICQAVNPEDREAPTRTLSRYFNKDVYLVLKGPRPRHCPPTSKFPALNASTFYQDGYPLLVVSEESLVSVAERLRSEVGKQGIADRWGADDLVIERFRPNIVLAGAGVPWAEDTWETIRVGNNASIITLVSKCTRCLLPNVDPDTGVRDKAVPYKVLMKFRTGKDPARLSKPCFGCNGVPSVGEGAAAGAGCGVVRVGDSVTVLTAIER